MVSGSLYYILIEFQHPRTSHTRTARTIPAPQIHHRIHSKLPTSTSIHSSPTKHFSHLPTTKHSKDETGRKTARPKDAQTQTTTMEAIRRYIVVNVLKTQKTRKAHPLPHTEIILNNIQRKRKRWQMNSTKAETTHNEHETAKYTAQNNDQTENPTQDTHEGIKTSRTATQREP